MSEPRFTEQQIAFILEHTEDEASVLDVCREIGISAETYRRWRKRYGGLTPAGVTRLQLLESENLRLRELVARLITDNPPTQPPEDAPIFLTRPREATELETVEAEGSHALITQPMARGAWQGFSEHARTLAARLPTLLAALRARVARWALDPAARAALIDGASLWLRQSAERLSSLQVRDLIVRISRSARESSRGREALIVGVIGGLIAGFAVGLESTPLKEDGPAPAQVERSIRLNSHSSISSLLQKGWDRPQPWGTWMWGNEATILIGFDAPARGDVELMIEARTQPLQGITPPTLIVRFNDAELGRWQLPAQARDLRRRFIVPEAVFNRSTDARLSFEIPASAPTPTVFGVQALSLRDARHLHNFRGFVDACSRDKLVGWAIAEGTAVSVAASVDGEPMKAVLSNLERPDLAAQGLPDDAGFVLTPATPIAAGSKVEVRFANGRPLIGSPCAP